MPQPSQSPILNTDACIFAALSKRVTEAQDIAKGSIELALEGEEIWQFAKQAFDNLPDHVIAKSYAQHHQFVNAIFHDKGGDDFTHEENALHVGAVAIACLIMIKKEEQQLAEIFC